MSPLRLSPTRLWLFVTLLLACPAAGQLGDGGEPQPLLPGHLTPPPSPTLAPEQAKRTIELDPELRLELVCSEPFVQDPIALSFDADGRFWVVEMRGFMPTIDGQNENAPVGRVRVLEDTTGDGRPDRAVTFLDHLVLPRAVAPVRDGALVADAERLLFARDLNGDLRADEIVVVDPEYSFGRNVEHQPNGLMRGIDNWHYSANSRARYRSREGRWIKEKTEFRGQWGITQDDYGRLYYNVNYSQLHGDIAPPSVMNRNPRHPAQHGLNLLIASNQHVFPIRMNTGVNRGYRPGILDESGRLRVFTSACAPLIYRGDHLPTAYRDNAFVCEPAGNLIKRNVLARDGMTAQAAAAYADREFLASTDERFRPVALATGLDGALYLVDMYRGILQHKDFMTSHLRKEILARQLDQPIRRGRIYRVARASQPPRRPTPLSTRTSSELVALLSHPNGPTRDSAQRLLVERADRAVAPELVRLAREAPNHLGRVHALWTLEGLECVEPGTWLAALEDPHPQVQIAALRILQSGPRLDSSQWRDFHSSMRQLAREGSEEVRFHAALAGGQLPLRLRVSFLFEIVEQHAEHPLFRDAVLSGLAENELMFIRRISRAEDASLTPGQDALLSALAAAVVRGRQPAELVELLAVANQAKPEWRQSALLAGVKFVTSQAEWQPIALENAPADGVRGFDLFSWPGHQPKPALSMRRLNDQERRWYQIGREQFVAICAACHGVDGQGVPSLAPPLAHSEWVLGNTESLIRIVLHGMEGPVFVNGVRYAPPLALPDMPALAALDDRSISGILTYIRRAWDHAGDPISPEEVARVRMQSGDRDTPYTAEELSP